MLYPRSSGILLHPTSLPGRYGVGDLGEWAYRFVDYLEATSQTIWQVLPLGPTSYGDSPYQALSAFAGNTLFISLDKLVGAGWLTNEDLTDVPDFPAYVVDFGPVITYHDQKLSLAYERFVAQNNRDQNAAFAAWAADNTIWLEDFALFAALKDAHGGQPWVEWPTGEALSEPDTLIEARKTNERRINEHRFRQWLFYTHWLELKAYANSKGIRLVGDIPIFVAGDSSDVWGNRDLFYLDETGRPTVIAGVPPDYFSETGQRWGNPLYRWDVMKQQNYRWWISRFRASLQLVDVARIDHFRGFEAYWEVPATEETAVNGRWVPGPGFDLFNAVKDALGELPIIAEDLGVITPGVEALRDGFGLPGMKILQFAFTPTCGENDFLPHHYIPNCVVYTGTHDNNTTLGWWRSGEADQYSKECMAGYLNLNLKAIKEPHWELIRLGMMSVAHTFIMPFQDILGYGEDTRMNTPGRSAGNWSWRFEAHELQNPVRDRLRGLTQLYSRAPEEPEADEEETVAAAKA